VTVRSARGAIAARALVTRRLRPLAIEGQTVHQVGIPLHWGFAGESVGGSANDLTALIAEVNVSMHEGKVFTCRVEAGLTAGLPPRPTKSPAPWPADPAKADTPPSARPEGGFTHGG
jgi:formate dehydrogenase major subunit